MKGTCIVGLIFPSTIFYMYIQSHLFFKILICYLSIMVVLDTIWPDIRPIILPDTVYSVGRIIGCPAK